MIDWEVVNDSLRVGDSDNAELTISGIDFGVEGEGTPIQRPVDETVVVTASELRLPHAVVSAHSLGTATQHELDTKDSPRALPPGEYILDIDTTIKSYLRFSGAAMVRTSDDCSTLVLSFPERTRIKVGLRSRHELPVGTITVPESPAGVAEGITHLSSAQKTTRPDRTYPTLRGHPPLLVRGDELVVPDDIQRQTTDEIELVLPPNLETVLIAAPLAYYLQASVSIVDDTTPRIEFPTRPASYELDPMPSLERNVTNVLRKTFFLDCLVRNEGPHSTNLAELSLLDALGIDAASLYDADPSERYETYMDVPLQAVEHRLPEWHLATYVAPTYENVEALPFLLDQLSMIYLPRTSELDGQELIERSLEDFYRGPGSNQGDSGTVASVDMVKPELKSGRVHGWLGDGVPIDVFKSTLAAYHNRLEYLNEQSPSIDICVVMNDSDMSGEQKQVAEIYRARSTDLPIEVTVKQQLMTEELADVFTTGYDFVHYIGHCETDGLRCANGYLSISSLEKSRAQTFFLNACGSYYEGTELVEKGSVAGAVTFTKVLNDHAVKVGSTFATLLVHGFSIERAMRLARRRIMMGKDYAVVGDGTHSLTNSDQQLPTTARIEQLENGSYHLTIDCYLTRETGSYYVPDVSGNEHSYLCGTESNFVLEWEELIIFLEETPASVIYDGDIYWYKQLCEKLHNYGPP